MLTPRLPFPRQLALISTSLSQLRWKLLQLWTVDYLKLSGVFNLTPDSSFPACFHPQGTRAPPLCVNSAELLTSSRSVSLH